MSSPAPHPRWDIFCNVIDNYGDIGVCWRLARQLEAEHGLQLRLWVDELSAFQLICPEVDPAQASQMVGNIEICRWESDFPSVTPGDVVIEAFACQLPESFVEAMAARATAPVWVNLDYLSAESWVSGCHGLPSPHPRLRLIKHFFFPGFSTSTGGLLRECDLARSREGFQGATEQQQAFWRDLCQSPPAPEALLVSLFSYENPNLARLLSIWAAHDAPVVCLLPETRSLPDAEAFAGHCLEAGNIVRRGNLELRIMPFVSQWQYDRLLWLCDINFVRGEDSFVRAQWAAKPMVWHIYPQDEDAHLVKLNAFLDLYGDGLAASDAAAVRRLFHAWNDGQVTTEIWTDWLAAIPRLRRHAIDWENFLGKQEDLCSSLVRFCCSKL